MSDLQGLCKKLHPVIKSIGEGADFLVSSDGLTWVDVDKALSALSFLGSCEFKEKPRTIKIGDFDVPEPMRNAPDEDQYFYTVTPHLRNGVTSMQWRGCGWQYTALERGLIHEKAENAEAHAMALISLMVKK